MTERKPLPVRDPAGLDEVFLAAGKGVARFLETAARQRLGMNIQLWDGADGLGAVLAEHLKDVGVPNKRAVELLTPRAVLNFTTGKKRRARRKVAR